MPYIRVTSSVPVSEAAARVLIRRVTDLVATLTDKDEEYVMVHVDQAAGGIGGQPGPAAFVDVRAIGGLNDMLNARITAALCTLIEETLQIPADAVYLNFSSVRSYNWGWNGRVFG